MIGILFVVGAIVFLVSSDMAKKSFKENCLVFFAFVGCVFACLVFVASAKFKFEFNLELLPYALLFACCYAPSTLLFTYAYIIGSFSFTGLAISYSLLLPTLYGIIFLKAETTWAFYTGLVLLCVTIYLITIRKHGEDDKEKENKTSLKWLLFVAIAFVANGFCSIVQTAEQIAFNGKYKNEMMIIGLAVSAVIFLTVSLIIERKKITGGLKNTLKYGCFSGVFNGLMNLCILFAINYMPSSIVFPLTSGGGLMLTFVAAGLFFKEKYSVTQYIGFAVSVVSIVLLNL